MNCEFSEDKQHFSISLEARNIEESAALARLGLNKTNKVIIFVHAGIPAINARIYITRYKDKTFTAIARK